MHAHLDSFLVAVLVSLRPLFLPAPRLGPTGTRADRPDSSAGQQASWKHGPRYHGGRWGIFACDSTSLLTGTTVSKKYNVDTSWYVYTRQFRFVEREREKRKEKKSEEGDEESIESRSTLPTTSSFLFFFFPRGLYNARSKVRKWE